VDSGVSNPAGPEGPTFLDAVWADAPFPDHGAFLATVERVAGEWAGRGVFSAEQQRAIVDAARRAEEDLRV